jgi:hypothetical protein
MTALTKDAPFPVSPFNAQAYNRLTSVLNGRVGSYTLYVLSANTSGQVQLMTTERHRSSGHLHRLSGDVTHSTITSLNLLNPDAVADTFSITLLSPIPSLLVDEIRPLVYAENSDLYKVAGRALGLLESEPVIGYKRDMQQRIVDSVTSLLEIK